MQWIWNVTVSNDFDLYEDVKDRFYSENRMLRKIFRSKRDEVTGEWRRLHD
jgi:hypothetical protein